MVGVDGKVLLSTVIDNHGLAWLRSLPRYVNDLVCVDLSESVFAEVFNERYDTAERYRGRS